MIKLILFAILAYVFYKFLRVFSKLFDKKAEDSNLKQPENEQSKIKNEDIIDADFEEIETKKNEEKKD